MKVIVFGAAGNAGRSVVRACLTNGTQVSLAARNLKKLEELFSADLLANHRTFAVDSLDAAAVGAAMHGHDVAVNAAGHAFMGDDFIQICDIFIVQAERHLNEAKRAWLFGGLPVLTFPQTNILGTELSTTSAALKRHQANFARLQSSRLDWSMICPGPLSRGQDEPRTRNNLRISTDVMPFDVPDAIATFSDAELSELLKTCTPQTIVRYADVAHIIAAHIGSNGPLSRKRVGIALPVGEIGVREKR